MNVKELSLPMPKSGKPITEQEYLQTCNTEQLAEWVVHLADDCTMQHECNLCNSWCDEKRVIEWLKQPHKPIS